MSRKHTLKTITYLLILLTLLLASCKAATEEAPPEAGPSDYEGDLVISVWGGTTEEFIREYAEPKFSELYPKVTVLYDVGGMSARFNKLLAQKDSPEADIFVSTSEALVSAIKESLVVKINPDNIPNMDALYDWAMPESEYGAAYSAIAYGLGYNSDFFGDDPPDSWSDLWRPEVQGKIAVPANGHSMMLDFIITSAEMNGGSADNPDPGFDALAEIKPVAQTYFYTDWNALFNAGDVVLATDFDYYINTMADSGSNIKFVIPKEKAFGSLQHLSVVAGTENQEAAEAFINILLSAEVQEAVGTKLLNAPARSDIELSAELADRLACYGDSLNDIRWFDPTFNSDHRPAWSEMMNEKVAPSWGQ